MKSKNKTAAEQRWLDTVVEFATDSTWLSDMYAGHVADPYQFQIDHILGAQAKRKINGLTTKVGEVAIMPIPIELHDITSNHALNRTLKPANFRNAFGHEKQVWLSMINRMDREGYDIPWGADIILGVVS